ncbi:hypothetical protein [Persephonella sp.]
MNTDNKKSFTVREDFKPVEEEIYRLYMIGERLKEFDLERWSYLKNMEDFNKIYSLSLEDETKSAIERIYEDGRAIAHDLWQVLLSVNIREIYPDFLSFIKRLDSNCIDEDNIQLLKLELKKRKESYEDLKSYYGFSIRAIEGMILLFEQQLKYMENICETVQQLKSSELYRKSCVEVFSTSGSGFVDKIKKIFRLE